jgi:hypothetical protein
MAIKEEIGLWLWFILLFGWLDVLMSPKEEEGTNQSGTTSPTN